MTGVIWCHNPRIFPRISPAVPNCRMVVQHQADESVANTTSRAERILGSESTQTYGGLLPNVSPMITNHQPTSNHEMLLIKVSISCML